MFAKLLEKNDKIMYQLFYELKAANTQNIATLATKTGIESKSLRRLINLWSKHKEYLTTGVSFVCQKDMITVFVTGNMEKTFYSTLLRRSKTFQLLLSVIRDPYARFNKLASIIGVSEVTLRRRKKILNDFLTDYQVTLSFECDPVLKGEETQIRWLFLLVSLAYDPPFVYQGSTIFSRYEEVQQFRIRQGFTLHDSNAFATNTCYQLPFQLDDRSLLYIWRQLTGCIPLEVSSEVSDAITFALNKAFDQPNWLLDYYKQKIIHWYCLATFFHGSILPEFPNQAKLSKPVQTFHDSLLNRLKDYATISKQHPELLTIFMYLLDRAHFNANISQISEDDD